MSTPEQPGAQGLTRKQLREMRMTGATPIVTPPPADESADTPDAEHAVAEAESHDLANDIIEGTVEEASEAGVEEHAETDDATPPAPAVHLARPAEPVYIPEPHADADVDLGVSPLTRRQAREQERIRTASVPVITPEVMAAHTHTAPVGALDVGAETPVWAPIQAPDIEDAGESQDVVTAEPERDDATAADSIDAESTRDVAEPEADAALWGEPRAAVVEEEPEDAPVVAEAFGAGLLAEPEPQAVLAPSFDELIARSGSPSTAATPSALILQQIPESPSLAGPVAATGEVLITGSLALEGVGSRGHAPGAADGKEVDAVLIDGELPAHSSPTPIAASAAISTVKSTGEIIRPPAPERGGRLMLILAITAGALALALVGVLIVAFVTGVF